METNDIIYWYGDQNVFSPEGIFSEFHNTEYPWAHYHTYYEIMIMFHGSLKHAYSLVRKEDGFPTYFQTPTDTLAAQFECPIPINFQEEIVEKNTILIIPPNLCHYTKFIDPDTEYVNVTVTAKVFSDLVKLLNGTRLDFKNLPLQVRIDAEETATIKKQFSQTAEDATLSEQDRGALNKILACSALRFFFLKQSEKQTQSPDWLRELNLVINNPNYYALSIEELIASIPYSHSYICREFKNTFNLSLKKHLTSKKMQHACYLLRNTNLKVIMIANMLGYSNQGFFAGVFSSYYGVTPFDFRKQATNSKDSDA